MITRRLNYDTVSTSTSPQIDGVYFYSSSDDISPIARILAD